mmetsp:Transcript_5511/g.9709  ORF Transcript_5511/g.9709 Transcript_5511/m.9709 type:complete len:218 (-) Transcript_5511:187-840(-)
MEALAGMFPTTDRNTLSLALDAHSGDVNRTVEYLLSNPTQPESVPDNNSNNTLPQSTPDSNTLDSDLRQIQQLEADEQLAWNLQQAYINQSQSQSITQDTDLFPQWSLPSTSDIWNAVAPYVNSAAELSRTAYQSALGVIQQYMNENNSSNTRPLRVTGVTPTHSARDDDSEALTGSTWNRSVGSNNNAMESAPTRRRSQHQPTRNSAWNVIDKRSD